MTRVLRSLLIMFAAVSCTGERAPRNDTAAVEEPPPDEATPSARPSTWNASAGAMFAVRTPTGSAWIINPSFSAGQALDTLTASWNVEGASLELMDGAQVVSTGRLSTLRYDSTCAGWPTASVAAEAASPASPAWRLAFPSGRVEGVAFDSLPSLIGADSAARTRTGALTASKVPDDTVSAFRGRPFIVRQASRFSIGTDTIGTMYETVRLVAQEANPLQEQILIISEEGSMGEPEPVFFRREIGAEESMGSIELLGVLRVKASSRLALLVRREREAGFVLEWIERSPRGKWYVRWRSAVDGC